MRLAFTFFVLYVSFNCVSCKNGLVKSLTESMGQEVIEIGAPVKGLPPDLEEEPSAELDDDDKSATSTTLQAGSKKEQKKTTITMNTAHALRENRLADPKQDEEEERIEKELAEIYKDNIDYKADSSEAATVKDQVVTDEVDKEKPIGRSKYNFKFQPDSNNRAEVERFRTSVDEISCDRRITKLSASTLPKCKTTKKPNSAGKITANLMLGVVFTSAILNF